MASAQPAQGCPSPVWPLSGSQGRSREVVARGQGKVKTPVSWSLLTERPGSGGHIVLCLPELVWLDQAGRTGQSLTPAKNRSPRKPPADVHPWHGTEGSGTDTGGPQTARHVPPPDPAGRTYRSRVTRPARYRVTPPATSGRLGQALRIGSRAAIDVSDRETFR